jgi:hypothetical protein
MTAQGSEPRDAIAVALWVARAIEVSGDGMDRGYMIAWAEKLGIIALLDRALAESGR